LRSRHEEQCPGEKTNQILHILEHTLSCEKGGDGVTLKAFARLRLTTSGDNLSPRTVTLLVQSGPEEDEGEARIIEDDVNDKLCELLRRLDAESLTGTDPSHSR
jgi:hypothetical protein